MKSVMNGAQAQRQSDSGERLSCLMDGELDPGEGRAALARLCADEAARADWMLWHAVGDALRSSEVGALHAPRFAVGVATALQAEPAVLAPRALSAPALRRMLMPGVAAAAAALVLTVAALPMLRGAPAAGGAEVARVGAGARGLAQAGLTASLARSLPVSMIERPSRRESAQFEAYLAAHSQMSGSLGMPRTSLYLRQVGFNSPLDR